MTAMKFMLYSLIGLTIGGSSGALGIGGGVLLVPALIWLCGFEPRTAAGTTLAVLVVPVVLPAVWKYHEAGLIDLVAALWIAGSFALGAYLGASLVVNHLVPDLTLRLAFGLVMMYIAVRFIVASNSEAANAAAGLTAVGCAWVTYLGLRVLGRRPALRPNLESSFKPMNEHGPNDLDYYI
jgi:uncharacterized membrane protein YfcA